MKTVHLLIGWILEKIDKTTAMRYYYWAMQPYNKYPLYSKWFELFENTEISTLIDLKMIDLTYNRDISNYPKLTFKQYFDIHGGRNERNE